MMRIRAVVSIALVALPTMLQAQRLPVLIGRRHPGRAEPPPTAPAIARQLSYRRMRISVESYPVTNFVSAPAYVSGVSRWTSYGLGAHVDYRFTRFVAATMDATSTMIGGPGNAQTLELGTRLHRERTESRAYPFFDARVGYLQDYYNFFPSINGIAIGSPQRPAGFEYSRGFGASTGVGTELALTRRFSFTPALSFLRGQMNGYGYYSYNGTTPGGPSKYMMNTWRLTLALRYNPVRMISASGVR
jgi:hypothetical protein